MRRALILTLVLVGLASVSFAQGSASVSGRVLDPQEAALPGVRVELTNTATGETQAVTSNAEGIYSFIRVAPGDYTLAVGRSSPERRVIRVVLPLPEGPVTTRNSPLATVRETPSMTVRCRSPTV